MSKSQEKAWLCFLLVLLSGYLIICCLSCEHDQPNESRLQTLPTPKTLLAL